MKSSAILLGDIGKDGDSQSALRCMIGPKNLPDGSTTSAAWLMTSAALRLAAKGPSSKSALK